MRCQICGSDSDLVFESNLGVIPNNYYSEKTHNNFNFSINSCKNCLTVETLSNNVTDSQIFSDYTYRSPITPMDDESVSFLSGKIKHHLNGDINGLCEVGGNNGIFLSKLLPKLKNNGPLVHIDKVYPRHCPTASHLNSFLDSSLVYDFSLLKKFDVVVARHCMAHNKDILPFWKSLFSLVSNNGLVYVELADLSSTLRNGDYGQFYPEHRFSLSLIAINHISNSLGFEIVDVTNLKIHNGSIGVIISRIGSYFGLYDLERFDKENILNKISLLPNNFNNWLLNIENNLGEYSSIGLWGVSAKSVFTLNLLGNSSMGKISKLIDNTPEKQGKYPPGFSIPCQGESAICSSDIFLVGAPNYIDILRGKATSLNAEIINTYDFAFKK